MGKRQSVIRGIISCLLACALALSMAGTAFADTPDADNSVPILKEGIERLEAERESGVALELEALSQGRVFVDAENDALTYFYELSVNEGAWGEKTPLNTDAAGLKYLLSHESPGTYQYRMYAFDGVSYSETSWQIKLVVTAAPVVDEVSIEQPQESVDDLGAPAESEPESTAESLGEQAGAASDNPPAELSSPAQAADQIDTTADPDRNAPLDDTEVSNEPAPSKEEAKTKEALDNETDSLEAEAKEGFEVQAADTKVRFKVSDGTKDLDFSSLTITVTNAEDDLEQTVANGEISLPRGNFSYEIKYAEAGKRAYGTFTVLSSELTIVASFPGEHLWLSKLKIARGSSSLFDESLSAVNSSSSLSDTLAVNMASPLNATATLSAGIKAWANAGNSVSIVYHGSKTPTLSSGSKVNLTLLGGFTMDRLGAPADLQFAVTCIDRVNRISYEQTLVHTINRARSIASVSIDTDAGVVYSATAGFNNSKVSVPADVTELRVQATALESYNDGSYVVVNDQEANPDGIFVVPFTTDTMKLSLVAKNIDGSIGKTEEIFIQRAEASELSFVVDADVDLRVTHPKGADAAAQDVAVDSPEVGKTTYRYSLIKGQKYSYTAIKSDHFRVSGTFTAEDAMADIIPEFDEGNYLQAFDLVLGETAVLSESGTIEYEYSCSVKDSLGSPTTTPYATIVLKSDALAEKTVRAEYGSGMPVLLSSEKSKELPDLVAVHSNRGGRLEVIVSGSNDQGETVEQIYTVTLERQLTLTDGSTPVFQVEDVDYYASPATISDDKTDGYTVSVPEIGTELAISVNTPAEDTEVRMNGVLADNVSGEPRQKLARIPLTGTSATEALTIELFSGEGAKADYSFIIKKSKPIALRFTWSPDHAIFHLYDGAGDEIEKKNDGSYALIEGASYRYTLVASGYVSSNKEFVAEDCGSMHFAMEKAKDNNAIDPNIGADWGSFRGDKNNAVTGNRTPSTADEAVAYWYTTTGSESNVGQVIYVNNYLVTFSYIGKNCRLVMLDPTSGNVVAEGIMLGSGGTIPTYAEGMIFAPYTAGGVQAFNAKPRPQTAQEKAMGTYSEGVMVLDSLWYYRDALGGTAYSAVYYEDGCVYANWYNSGESALVCLTITDENSADGYEKKIPLWRWVRSEGFYWSGACTNSGFTVVGGEGNNPSIACFDAKTGKLLDSRSDAGTAIRSSITYDKSTNRYYYTCKNTGFWSVAIDKNGKFTDLKNISLGGESTSTPAIYNGRAYVGVQGESQFQSYSNHSIAVIDLKSFTLAYKVKTKGYAQSSGLVSTAYLNVSHYNPQTKKNETGFAYVYFTENVYPGRITYLIDKPGMTQPVLTEEEDGHTVAPILFDTRQENGQYCLTSVTVDAHGTIYIKTDSGQIIAVGSRIKELKIEQQPDKTVYRAGMKFDPTGLKVVAYYDNGSKRDITNYLIFHKGSEKLVAGTNSIFALFPYSLYNNRTPDAALDPSEEAVYAELGLDMPKLARPNVNVPIIVLTEAQAVTVGEVEAAIDAIGTVELSDISRVKIENARFLYDRLSATQKKSVKNYVVLLAAEKEYQRLAQLATGTVSFASVISDKNNVSVKLDGSINLLSSTEDLLESIGVSVDEVAFIKEGADIRFYVESSALDEPTSAQKAILESTLDQRSLEKDSLAFNLMLYKKVGNGAKTPVFTLLGNSALEFDFAIPKTDQASSRVFRLVNIQDSASQVINNEGNATKFSFFTNKFSAFFLTHSKDASIIGDPPKSDDSKSDSGNREPSGERKGNTVLVSRDSSLSGTRSGSALLGGRTGVTAGSLMTASANDEMHSSTVEKQTDDSAFLLTSDDGENSLTVREAGSNLFAILSLTCALAALVPAYGVGKLVKRRRGGGAASDEDSDDEDDEWEDEA